MAPPAFRAKTELTRHVDAAQRLPGNRPAPDVFIANPGDSHLSVNSVDLENLPTIVERYRMRQGGHGEVSVCVHKVLEYNSAAKNTAAHVTYGISKSIWEFADRDGIARPAYLHRPADVGDSHCGVEYVRVLQELEAHRVARRLAKRRYHLFH